jgi:hypothetical protein
MKDERRLKRAQFLLAGSALGLAACSNGALSPLASLGNRAATARLRNRPNARGPAAIFQGYNSLFGDARSTALHGTSRTIGGGSKVTCSVCTSAAEVASALEIDASLSVAYGPVASVDVKTKYMSSLNITTYSLSMIVRAKHTEGIETSIDVKLDPSVAVPSTDADIDAFVSGYGDSWVSEIVRGGEYFGTYTFFSETKEEQTALEASLHASGIYSGVTVNAGVEAKMSNFLKTANVRYTFNQEITGIANPSLPKPEQFIDYALSFPSLQLDSPTIIGFASSGYETVPGLDRVFRKVAENRRYFTVGDSAHPVGLATNLAAIALIKNQASDIQTIYNFYSYTGDATLASRLATARSDFDAIVKQMRTFESAATTTFPTLPLTSLKNGTPALNYDIGSSPDWGPSDIGKPFNDVDVRTYLKKMTRIAEVKLRGSSGFVEQIITTYEDANGVYPPIIHGNDTGTYTRPLHVLPGQSVQSVTARTHPAKFKSLLEGLYISLSDGRSIITGGTSGTLQPTWNRPSGSIVMGFHGRVGTAGGTQNFIYQFGVDYAMLKPAKWVPVP